MFVYCILYLIKPIIPRFYFHFLTSKQVIKTDIFLMDCEICACLAHRCVLNLPGALSIQRDLAEA